MTGTVNIERFEYRLFVASSVLIDRTVLAFHRLRHLALLRRRNEVPVSGRDYASPFSTGIGALAGARRCRFGGNTMVFPGGMRHRSSVTRPR